MGSRTGRARRIRVTTASPSSARLESDAADLASPAGFAGAAHQRRQQPPPELNGDRREPIVDHRRLVENTEQATHGTLRRQRWRERKVAQDPRADRSDRRTGAVPIDPVLRGRCCQVVGQEGGVDRAQRPQAHTAGPQEPALLLRADRPVAAGSPVRTQTTSPASSRYRDNLARASSSAANFVSPASRLYRIVRGTTSRTGDSRPIVVATDPGPASTSQTSPSRAWCHPGGQPDRQPDIALGRREIRREPRLRQHRADPARRLAAHGIPHPLDTAQLKQTVLRLPT